MGTSEAEVVDYFSTWLANRGWDVRLEVDGADLVATRDGRTVVAEVRGTTTSPGLDIDTAYGQLLRRMRPGEAVDYALVVPDTATRAALRVPEHVLNRLNISVFSVADDGAVSTHAGKPLAAASDAVPTRTSVDEIVASLSDFTRAWTRARVLSHRSELPSRGIYAWWFDDLATEVPVGGTVREGAWHLLYVGISPSRSTSKCGLPTRLWQHLKLNAEGSTLRLSLGSILHDRLDLQLRRVGTGKRLTFHCGEERLNDWLEDHARVVVFGLDEPWVVEPDVIGRLTLPINLDHNAGGGFADALSQLRADQRTFARQLPPNPACCGL